MKEPNKMFNLLLPFRQYQALRERGLKTDVPIAELIRRGVDFALQTSKPEKPAKSGD